MRKTKIRTFYRYEAAARLLWQRDDGVAVQLLASREEFPGGVNHAGRPPGVIWMGGVGGTCASLSATIGAAAIAARAGAIEV